MKSHTLRNGLIAALLVIIFWVESNITMNAYRTETLNFLGLSPDYALNLIGYITGATCLSVVLIVNHLLNKRSSD